MCRSVSLSLSAMGNGGILWRYLCHCPPGVLGALYMCRSVVMGAFCGVECLYHGLSGVLGALWRWVSVSLQPGVLRAFCRGVCLCHCSAGYLGPSVEESVSAIVHQVNLGHSVDVSVLIIVHQGYMWPSVEVLMSVSASAHHGYLGPSVEVVLPLFTRDNWDFCGRERLCHRPPRVLEPSMVSPVQSDPIITWSITPKLSDKLPYMNIVFVIREFDWCSCQHVRESWVINPIISLRNEI